MRPGRFRSPSMPLSCPWRASSALRPASLTAANDQVFKHLDDRLD